MQISDDKNKKFLLAFSPTLLNLIDTEAVLLETTRTQLIRTATLTWICRNHQVRIPTMFSEERRSEAIQAQMEELYKRLFQDGTLPDRGNQSKVTNREIYYKVYAVALRELDEALKRIR